MNILVKLLRLIALFTVVLASQLVVAAIKPALDDLVGRYSLSSSMLDSLELVISNEDGALHLSAKGGRLRELVQVSGLEFHEKDRDAVSFEFVTDSDGAINTFVVRFGAQTEKYTRAEILAKQRELLRDVRSCPLRADHHNQAAPRTPEESPCFGGTSFVLTESEKT